MKKRTLQKACSTALGISLAASSVSSLAAVYAAEPENTNETQTETVDKTELVAAIDRTIFSFHSSYDYTVASYDRFVAARNAAIEIKNQNDTTQEEVDAATETLLNNYRSLIDVTDLKEAMSRKYNIASNYYSAESYENMMDVYAECQALINEKDPTQAEVDEATERMNAAVDSLVRRDTSALSNAIFIASNEFIHEFTPDSYAEMSEAIEAGRAVQNDPNSTQEEIDAATEAINEARAALVKRADKGALLDAINKAKAVTKSDYTSDSYESLAAALQAAESVYEDDNVSQEATDAAAGVLNDAFENLVKQADKIALSNLLFRAGGPGRDEYTPETYDKFDEIRDMATAVYENEYSTQEEVDQAVQNLQEAMDALVKRADLTALTALMQDVRDLDKSDYTSSSYAAVASAFKEAKVVYGNANASQESVDAAYTALNDAYNALVDAADKTELQNTIAKGEAVNSALYTQDSYATLLEALSAAKEVNKDGDASQGSADAAAQNLTAAIDALVKTADKSQLNAAITSAYKLYSGDYTPESYAKAADALAAARNVEEDKNASQEAVDTAAAALNEAMNALIKLADKAELRTMLKDAVLLSEQEYTPASFAQFYEALENAKAVSADRNASQEEADAAVKALNDAVSALVKAADKTELYDAVSKAEAIDASVYTEETYTAVENALKEAKAVQEDANSSQEEADAAVKILNDAVSALVKATDKTALQSEADKAAALIAEDYTPESYEKVSAALADAKEVLANPEARQEEADAALNALSEAAAALVKAADKTELNDAVSKAEALDAAVYTEETYAAVENALKEAKAVQEDANASQEEADAAAKALNKALEALEEVSLIDASNYQFLVDEITKNTSGDLLNKYADGKEKEAFLAEFAKAQSVLANAISQEEVDAAEKALNKAFLNLRYRPDETTLRNLENVLSSLDILAAALNEEDAAPVHAMRARIRSAMGDGLDAVTAANLAAEGQNLIVEYAQKAEPAEEVKQITEDAKEKADQLQAAADAIAAGQQQGIAPEEAVAKLAAEKTSESAKPAENSSDTSKQTGNSTAKSASKNTSSSSVKTGTGAAPFAALGAAALAALRALKRRKHGK
jgi:hypothetical protein